MKAPLKILMLEDNDSDAEVIQHLLKKEKPGCEFTVTMTKEGYLDALDNFHPDLILSDNSMPQFNATEALEIINKRPAAIPFIMVTGTVSEEFAADIIKLGAQDYILKDRLKRLPAAIDAALKHRKAEKEKQDAEKKIIESENNLRTIFENTSEGFLLLDRNAFIKAFNSKAGEYTFVSRLKKIEIGQSIYDYVEDIRKEQFSNFILEALNGRKSQYERSFIHKNGDTYYIDFSITPVIEKGVVTGICITGRDITEKKKAEEQLMESFAEKKAIAERMSIILNTLSAHIALLDEEGYIIDVNDAWRNFADANGFIGSNYSIGDNYLGISNKATGAEEIDGKTVAQGIEAVLKNNLQEFVFEYSCHAASLKRWFRMIATPLKQK